MTAPVPPHLAEFWSQDLWALHSAEWWRHHWARTGLVEVRTADSLPDGWRLWLEWQRQIAPEHAVELAAVSRVVSPRAWRGPVG